MSEFWKSDEQWLITADWCVCFFMFSDSANWRWKSESLRHRKNNIPCGLICLIIWGLFKLKPFGMVLGKTKVETHWHPLTCQITHLLCKKFPGWLKEPLHYVTLMASSNSKIYWVQFNFLFLMTTFWLTLGYSPVTHAQGNKHMEIIEDWSFLCIYPQFFP
jgi:ammonia channel protein AmtB